MNNYISCPCQNIHSAKRDKLLEILAKIRGECIVLKEILIPEDYWLKFQEIADKESDSVGHKYKVLGALQHGNLSKITLPFHCYFTNEQNQPKKINPNYKKDFIEIWMEKEDEMERHNKSNAHWGKINEPLCALWLEKQGWQIRSLEAIDDKLKCDIEAISPNDNLYSIEIKTITMHKSLFYLTFENKIPQEKKPDKSTSTINGSYNYFLFRVYEASCQLSKSINKKLAIIIFNEFSWYNDSLPIIDDWIKEKPISFLDNAGAGWKKLIEDKRKKDKDIEVNLDNNIKRLDEIWVLQQTCNLDFLLEKKYSKHEL